MSSGSERMIEMQQEKSDQELAKKLGITYDELMQLDYEIDTEESEDGLIYNYIIKFRDDSPREILEKINGIDEQNHVWFPSWEFENDDYSKEQYEAIIANKKFLIKFQEEIENLEGLNEVELPDKNLETILKRQIFIGVIGTLETFLSDTFINLIMDNDNYFKNFVETYPEFKQRKFELRHIFVEESHIKETVRKVLIDIIYHDLHKVGKMYADTFKIEFPKIGPLMKIILSRHDLIHRNGKTKDGQDVIVDKQTIIAMIEKVNKFVLEIADALHI
jgi:hypothetical protein